MEKAQPKDHTFQAKRETEKSQRFPLTRREEHVLILATTYQLSHPGTRTPQVWIAREMGVTKGAVNQLVWKISGKGQTLPGILTESMVNVEPKNKQKLEKRAKREALFERIASLHRQGLTIGQMHQRTGEPFPILASALETLRQRGEIERRRTRRTQKEINADNERINKLRSAGFSNQQIADILGKSYRSITNANSEMLAKGKAKSRRGQKPKRKQA